jgi:hypothetical protein
MELMLNRVPWWNCAAGRLTFVLNYQIPVRVSWFSRPLLEYCVLLGLL